jgi:hypothetical protein
MNRLKSFSTTNPTGETPGMEPVRLDVLKAAVNNTAELSTSTPKAVPLVSKNLRLPADLVDYVDYIFTKEQRLKKQDAYTQALEAYFRPKMQTSDQ